MWSPDLPEAAGLSLLYEEARQNQKEAAEKAQPPT